MSLEFCFSVSSSTPVSRAHAIQFLLTLITHVAFGTRNPNTHTSTHPITTHHTQPPPRKLRLVWYCMTWILMVIDTSAVCACLCVCVCPCVLDNFLTISVLDHACLEFDSYRQVGCMCACHCWYVRICARERHAPSSLRAPPSSNAGMLLELHAKICRNLLL